MSEEDLARLKAEHARYREALVVIADMSATDAKHYAADDARHALDGEDS
jgi:hypothetical protein